MRVWLAHAHAEMLETKLGASNLMMMWVPQGGRRETAACRVSMAPAATFGGERLATLTGQPSAVHDALEILLDRIDEGNAEVGLPPEVKHSLKLCLGQKAIGAVIGKGGAQIKLVRESSGANVKVETLPDGHLDPSSGMRICAISGGRAEVLRAIQLVSSQLTTVPDEPPYEPPAMQAAKYQRTAEMQPQYGAQYAQPQYAAQYAAAPQYAQQQYVPQPDVAPQYAPQYAAPPGAPPASYDGYNSVQPMLAPPPPIGTDAYGAAQPVLAPPPPLPQEFTKDGQPIYQQMAYAPPPHGP